MIGLIKILYLDRKQPLLLRLHLLLAQRQLRRRRRAEAADAEEPQDSKEADADQHRLRRRPAVDFDWQRRACPASLVLGRGRRGAGGWRAKNSS